MMHYFNIPNLPDRAVKGVLADFRISADSIRTLEDMGITVYKTVSLNVLYNAVCGHADMQLHMLTGGRFVTAPEAFDYYKALLPDAHIISGEKRLFEKYPLDTAYNAAAIGNVLICSEKHTSKKILAEYVDIINVKQGYSKCSVCIVNEHAFITSDKGIYAATKNRFDILLIEPEFISLPQLPYGFIGGASGLIAPNILAVNGDIHTHKNADDITAFCRNHGIYILSLNSGIITDIGSLIPLF